MRKTGPTNEHTIRLVAELKKKSIEDNVAIWKKVAVELELPTRRRKIVNLSKIDRFASANETILVPGKLLASGNINQKITVVAYSFSKQAKEKVESAGGKAFTINQFIKENPKSTNLRIMS